MPRSSRTGVLMPLRPGGSAAPELHQLGTEVVDVVRADERGRNEELVTRRDARAVALHGLGEQRDRLIAELVRLLDDGPGDGTALHPRQRLVVFVEGDDLDLS